MKDLAISRQCEGKRWSNWSWVKCSRKAGDSGFCGTHDPEKVAARDKNRRQKSDAAYEAKKAVWDRDRRVTATTIEIVGFVRALSEDPRTLPWFETARQLIAKLEGK